LCTYVDRLVETGRQNLPVYAINLSGQSLSDDNFLHFLIDALDTTKLPKENICFEITETAAIVSLTKVMRLISILKGMGIQFSLDDFGSGLSSFNYLKNLKVDFVKIDGSFIRGIDTNEVDYNMVLAINKMAQTMGMKTIAEAVETEAIWKKLQDIGVDYIQGYYTGHPAPLADSWQESTPAMEGKIIPLHRN
jgi:EAL domain-containing protein (putative c-di-GMP-specific phosphodiesterase class I)